MGTHAGTSRSLERRDLSEKQIREFYERGYTVVEDVFSAAEIVHMRAAFDRLQRMAERMDETRDFRGARFVVEDGKIHRIVWCGGVERLLLDAGADRRLTGMAARLLGSPEMNHLINQAHFKLPGDGVGFPWHQDSTHRRYGTDEWTDVNGRGSYVQTVTAIDDATRENGPLWLIPFSGSLGHLGLPEDGRLPAGIHPGDARPGLMRAGSVLLFGPYVIHGSQPNRSQRARRTLINGYAYPGANRRVYPGSTAGRLLRLS